MLDKKVIFTILSAILLSFFIGLFFTKVPTSELSKQLFIYKVHSSQQYDLLIAGDSRVYRGVSPKVFEDSLGLSAFNLGFSSGMFDDKLYHLIDEKIDEKSEQKIIVLGITPNSLIVSICPLG